MFWKLERYNKNTEKEIINDKINTFNELKN